MVVWQLSNYNFRIINPNKILIRQLSYIMEVWQKGADNVAIGG